MPELPEVTTTVQGIKEKVVGKTIADVWSDWPKTIKTHPLRDFKKEVVGKKITGTERVGKNILIHLSGGKTMVVHMKMTGHLLYGEYEFKKKAWIGAKPGPLRDDSFNKWIHVIFSLTNGKSLALSDMRKFAKICLRDTKTVRESPDLIKVGPDALEINRGELEEILLKRPKGRLKQALLNQELISGIGNIYSDEALWRAGLHPEEAPKNMSREDFQKLHKAIRFVLKKGIDFGGDSMSDYRNIDGERGNFQTKHQAYRRTGKECPKKDGGIIERIIVGGRSSHFCNFHQKKK